MKPIILSILAFCINFFSIIAQIDNNQLSFDDFKSTLRKDMDNKTIVKTFGQPDKDIGSGIYVYVYKLSDSTAMIIGCTDQILYARHCDNKNKLLYDLFLLRDSYDGVAAEIYPHHFWSVLNLWRDNEIVDFINNLNDKNKKQFVDYISDNFVTFPIEKPLTYYKLFYPETLKLILTNK